MKRSREVAYSKCRQRISTVSSPVCRDRALERNCRGSSQKREVLLKRQRKNSLRSKSWS